MPVGRFTATVWAAEDRISRTFATERAVARFAIVAASHKPKTFVLPSDPDFVRILNDPSSRGVEYLLAVPPTGRGQADTLNRRYPTLYDNGADVATLELEVPNDGDGQPNWRIYRVNEPGPNR